MKYILSLWILCFPLFGFSQFGELDLNFDGDGLQTVLVHTFNSDLSDIKVLPDGKILGCGDGQVVSGGQTAALVYRLFPDGSLDNTFGVNGEAGVAISDTSLQVTAMDLTPDGDILLAGYRLFNGVPREGMIIKLNGNDGSLDAGFGTNGIVVFPHPFLNTITGIEVSSNGKINVAGDLNSEIYGARFNSDGSFDNSFSFDGEVTVAVTQGQHGRAMTIDNEGKMIIAGATDSLANADYVLIRINPDGTLDDSFGNNGLVRNDTSPFDTEFFGVNVGATGKYVAVGYKKDAGGDSDLLVARFNNDGSLDNSFNGNGILQMDFNEEDVGNDVMFQPDGKIIVCGITRSGIFPFSFITRITLDGQLDQTFGNGGTSFVGINLTNGTNSFEAMALQEDLKILSAGGTAASGLIARYTSGLNLGIGDVDTYIGSTLIYPNPVSDQLTVEYELKSSQKVAIELLDMSGKRVVLLQPEIETPAGEQVKSFNLPLLKSGNYLLQLRTVKGTVGVKLTVN